MRLLQPNEEAVATIRQDDRPDGEIVRIGIIDIRPMNSAPSIWNGKYMITTSDEDEYLRWFGEPNTPQVPETYWETCKANVAVLWGGFYDTFKWEEDNQ